MTIVVTYMAEDGTEFYNLKDCFAYEKRIFNLPSCIEWYDDEGNRLEPYGTNEIEAAYNLVRTYVIQETPTWREDFKFFDDYYGYGIGYPSHGMYPELGTYLWDSRKQDWVLCKEK